MAKDRLDGEIVHAHLLQVACQTTTVCVPPMPLEAMGYQRWFDHPVCQILQIKGSAAEGAKGRSIPPPHEGMSESDKPMVKVEDLPEQLKTLDAMYKVLPPDEQDMHLWAQLLPGVYDAEMSETNWSEEYFANWLSTPQVGTLGSIPLIVLSRAEGGYIDGDADISAAQLEKERKEGQAKLTLLSTNSRQIVVNSGHNMQLEVPEDVSTAIRQLIEAVRHNHKL